MASSSSSMASSSMASSSSSMASSSSSRTSSSSSMASSSTSVPILHNSNDEAYIIGQRGKKRKKRESSMHSGHKIFNLFGHKEEIHYDSLPQRDIFLIKDSVKSYLHILVDFMQNRGALETLEYLLRIYRIHILHWELFLCAMPYHHTEIFRSIVQVVPGGQSKWNSLLELAKAEAPLARSSIVRYLEKDEQILPNLCKYLQPKLLSKHQLARLMKIEGGFPTVLKNISKKFNHIVETVPFNTNMVDITTEVLNKCVMSSGEWGRSVLLAIHCNYPVEILEAMENQTSAMTEMRLAMISRNMDFLGRTKKGLGSAYKTELLQCLRDVVPTVRMIREELEELLASQEELNVELMCLDSFLEICEDEAFSGQVRQKQ